MTISLLIGGARSGKSSLALQRARKWRDNDQLRPVCFVATGVGGDPEMSARILHHQRERPSDWFTVEAPLDLVQGVASARQQYGPCGLIIDCLSFWVANHLMPVFDTDDNHLNHHNLDHADEQHLDGQHRDGQPLESGAVSGDMRGSPSDSIPVDHLSLTVTGSDDNLNHLYERAELVEALLLESVQNLMALLHESADLPAWIVTNDVGGGLAPTTPLGRVFRDVLGRVNAEVSRLADYADLVVAGRVLSLERP
jgi:adenosyl cobinamide kinase/adenosyl cobinamide phosphate guanylyltransferase